MEWQATGHFASLSDPCPGCHGRGKFGNQSHFDLFLGVKCIQMVEMVGVSGEFLLLGFISGPPSAAIPKSFLQHRLTQAALCLGAFAQNLCLCWKLSFIHSPTKYKWKDDPEIPGLGRYLQESKAGTRSDACTPMFIAALCTIAKRWKPPKCALTGRWMNEQNVGYTRNGI